MTSVYISKGSYNKSKEVSQMKFDLGNNIRNFRKKRNMTLKILGEKVGYAENSVWQWEHNKREPNIQSLLQLSQIFEISIIELLGGTKMENGLYEFNGKEYSLYEEVKKYDNDLPDWKIEEYLTFKLRVINWCEEKGYQYEHSTGRELLLILIPDNGNGQEKSGVLLEVPEQSHFDSDDKYKQPPYAFFSLGNEEDGYRVETNIELSICDLENALKDFSISEQLQTL